MDLWQDIRLSETVVHIGQVILSFVLILILMRIAIRILFLTVDKVFTQRNKMFAKTSEVRLKTLAGLIKSAVRYGLYFVAGVMILDQFGLDTGSLIAAAGIGGLAIGFGAQNLVRDLVTGFFILLEDQFDIGDYVTISDVSGLVEDIGIRITKVRDFGGELHIIPNGEIKQVTNHMGDAMRVLVEVDIAYEVDVNRAIQVLEELFAQLSQEIEDLVEGPTVLGVQELGDSGVKLLTLAKSKPMQQWAVGREIRKRIKLIFDDNEIEIPYPRRYLIHEHEQATKPVAEVRQG